MKLFLASSLDKSISLLTNKLLKPGKECRVVFIANAADDHKDPWWVNTDREAFTSLGCNVVEVDLRATSANALQDILNKSDIIHVCGGSVLYLLSVLQKNNFVELIADAVRKGKILYTGTSAGSMIVSKDVTLSQFDEEERESISKVSSFSGLGLVDFMILPHSNNPAFVESNKEIMAHTIDNNTPLIVINDDQVVYVEDKKFEILTV